MVLENFIKIFLIFLEVWDAEGKHEDAGWIGQKKITLLA